MRTELMEFVARALFLPMLVVAAALLVKGYAAPGGGFAAGAVAGVAILLQRIVFGPEALRGLVWSRTRHCLLAGGLLLALGVAVVPALAGGAPFAHVPRPGADVARFGALELHTNLIFDAGVCLVVLAFVFEIVALVSPEPDPEEDRS